jgi:hypothetical protein
MRSNSVLAQIDKSTLECNLYNGTQISYVYDGESIQAHASLYSKSNLGILGSLVVSSSLHQLGIDRLLIRDLEDYVVIDIRDESASSLIRYAYERDYVCLGIFPSGCDSLNMLGFASKKLIKRLPSNYVTSNNERENFVKTILVS